MMKQTVRALLACLAIAAMAPHALAQQIDTRSEKLREHEKKIKEIIDKRRAEAAEKEEKDKQASLQPVEIQDAPTAPGPAKPLSTVVMGFKFTNEAGDSNYNSIVEDGDTFLTEVFLFNSDQNPIDKVRLALTYDKRFIEPVKVFDTTLRPYAEEPPVLHKLDRESALTYEVKLKTPIRTPEVVLLRILWKAIRPAPYTGIDFTFDPLEREDHLHTAISAQGKNILGLEDDPADGVLSGGLMIEKAAGESTELQGKGEELRGQYLGSVASTETVGLQLIAPHQELRTNDVFRVRVRLNNPEGALVDALNFFVKFDPDVLEVVDADEFNYISRGVNVLDGPYHLNFPWDMHKRNEVRNESGIVNYQMSLSNGASLPSKTVADIYFKALAPTAATEIYFVKAKLSDTANTSIRYFGFERLDLEGKLSLPGVKLEILPAPAVIASEPEANPAPIAVLPEEPAIRPLLIERR
ncbi:hypothetical protein BH09SUM1_BH09SUM1_04250 [soil metagenome]